jgi:hypothetical protein
MVDGAMELLVWLRKTKKTAKNKNKTENKGRKEERGEEERTKIHSSSPRDPHKEVGNPH